MRKARRWHLLGVPALALAGAILYAELGREDGRHTLTVGERERSYLVRVPPGAGAGAKLPLVIVLHGGGGNAASAERMTQMTPFAARKGFVVVYPDGTGRFDGRLLTWNSGNCCGYAHRNQVDDVAFLRALVREVVRTQPVDPKRVYVTGMSNGGMMAHRVAQEMGDLVAAVAPVAGAMNSKTQSGPSVGVLMIHGDQDRHVLVGGGKTEVGIESGRVDTSLEAAAQFWVGRNGLSGTRPVIERKGEATHTRYAGGFAVESVVIAGEGHTWPGGRGGTRRADAPSKTVIANELIWEFFLRHRRG